MFASEYLAKATSFSEKRSCWRSSYPARYRALAARYEGFVCMLS